MSRNDGNYVDLLLLLDEKAIHCEEKPHSRGILKHKYHIENVMFSAMFFFPLLFICRIRYFDRAEQFQVDCLWLCVVVHVSAKMHLVNVFLYDD